VRLPKLLSAKKPEPPKPVEPDEEGDERDEPGKDRRKHILLVWLYLKQDTDERLRHLTELLAKAEEDGGLTSEEWAIEFRLEMRAAHSHAHAVGRNLAGDLGAYGQRDADAGSSAWEGQEEFFGPFLDDLNADRYGDPKGDGFKGKQFGARVSAYLAATRGTASESFRVHMGDELLEWVLGDLLHCGPEKGFLYDCPSLSEEPPKPASEWPTAPGRGDCPCRSRCGCVLRATDRSYSTEGL
jgi:hypothetical protein